MPVKPILVISGTNRPGSNSLRIATHVRKLYENQNAPTDFYSLTEMPPEIFDPSSYAKKPDAWQAVQQRVLDSAGLHIVTPEYNGSFPGVLKYFIDMLKADSFERRPIAFVGIANGIFGALRPVEQLQMVFGYRNAVIFPERIFIAMVGKRFDATGAFVDAEIESRLVKQTTDFTHFLKRFP